MFAEEQVLRVVVNDEGQYSVWYTLVPPPAGWQEVGIEGSKEECLAYIEEVWVDIRPLSMRVSTA